MQERERFTILIAEDDAEMVLLFQRAVRAFPRGIGLQVVPSGVGVLQYLSNIGPYIDRELFPAPKILLLDVKLPLMDGFEVLRTLRMNAEFQELPVVLVSDFDDPGRVKRAYEMGATSYLLKPVTLGALTSLMGMLIRNKGRFDAPPFPIYFRPPPARKSAVPASDAPAGASAGEGLA